MKAERKEEEKWVPIVITLESKEEAQYLWGCLNVNRSTFINNSNSVVSKVNAATLVDKLQDRMFSMMDNYRKYFSDKE